MSLIDTLNQAKMIELLERFRYHYIDTLKIPSQHVRLHPNRAVSLTGEALGLALRGVINKEPFSHNLPDSYGWGEVRKLFLKLSLDDLRWVMDQALQHMQATLAAGFGHMTEQTACKTVDEAFLWLTQTRIQALSGQPATKPLPDQPSLERLTEIIATELTGDEKVAVILKLHNTLKDLLTTGVEPRPADNAHFNATEELIGCIESALLGRYTGPDGMREYQAKLKELGLD